MPKISVIVPVYNTEKYLHRCIDSILAQTFTDFELLLIDDGSKDNSGAICDEYAAKDQRVRVFHKKNGGVSSARNLGLDNAQGEWITFVDSDDWLQRNYLNSLYKVDEITDISSCYYKAFGWEKWIPQPLTDVTYKYEDIKDGIKQNIMNFNVIWCKLFKAEIIRTNNIRFIPQISYGEDTIFMYQFLVHIKSMRTCPDVIYNYDCSRTETLSRNYDKNCLGVLDLICQCISSIEDKFKICLQKEKLEYGGLYLYYILYNIKRNESNLKVSSLMKEIIQNRHILNYLKDNKIVYKTFKKRIFEYMLVHRYFIFCTFIIKNN